MLSQRVGALDAATKVIFVKQVTKHIFAHLTSVVGVLSHTMSAFANAVNSVKSKRSAVALATLSKHDKNPRRETVALSSQLSLYC